MFQQPRLRSCYRLELVAETPASERDAKAGLRAGPGPHSVGVRTLSIPEKAVREEMPKGWSALCQRKLDCLGVNSRIRAGRGAEARASFRFGDLLIHVAKHHPCAQ